MAHLCCEEAKELIEIALECDDSTQDIVKEIRRHTGQDLITTIQQVFGLLAVADHPKAEARYEAMRRNFSPLKNALPWSTARFKLQRGIPLKALL